MRLGYFDAQRMLYGLEGRIYYIEQTHEECYYLKKLTEVKKETAVRVLASYELNQNEGQELRNYMEIFLPLLAAELRLPKDWNYTLLYLALLETAARFLKIPRYRIYTVEELLKEIEDRAGDGIPDYLPEAVQILLGL